MPTDRKRMAPALAALAAWGALGLEPALAQGFGPRNPPNPAADFAPATTTIVPLAAGRIGAAARTARIVDAARAFLATLSPDEQKKVSFAFDDQLQRARWSNFPDGTVNRAGVRLGELNATQKWALWQLLGQLLSPQGMKMVNQQAAAEDLLKITPPTQTRGARFGSDYYYAAILGTPSTATPWEFQFGAHHLAINATIAGPRITLSPTMSGGQPLKYIDKDGRPVYITEDEVMRSMALLKSFTPAQRAKAVISAKTIDLVLGPGHDGQSLQPEGLPGGAMTAALTMQFLGVIEARLGMLNADTHATVMAAVRRDLDRTYFAWWGPSDQLGVAYFRVTGPTLILEYSPQGPDERYALYADHAHNMYRDPTNEYGTAWTKLPIPPPLPRSFGPGAGPGGGGPRQGQGQGQGQRPQGAPPAAAQ